MKDLFKEKLFVEQVQFYDIIYKNLQLHSILFSSSILLTSYITLHNMKKINNPEEGNQVIAETPARTKFIYFYVLFHHWIVECQQKLLDHQFFIVSDKITNNQQQQHI